MAAHANPAGPPAPGRIGLLAASLLETLHLRRTTRDPRGTHGRVTPSARVYAASTYSSRGISKRSRNSRSARSTEPRSTRSTQSARSTRSVSRRDDRVASGARVASGHRGLGVASGSLAGSSTRAMALTEGWKNDPSAPNTSGSRSSLIALAKLNAAAAKHKSAEAPEVVTNYVYDVPERKKRVVVYDGHDDDEFDDDELDDRFEDEFEDEDDEFDDDFLHRPFGSEDEDEMAYFAHRMGGADFKLLRRHVLHPHSRFSACWDTFLLLLITWVLILVPFELSFDLGRPLRRHLLRLDLFVDSMFLVDIILNFSTAVEFNGKLHFSFQSIFWHYTRGWFVPDLLWTFPFYAVLEPQDPGIYASDGSDITKLFRFAMENAWLYSLARCLRLMRVAKLPRLLRRLEHSLLISSKVSSLSSFVYVVLALSHAFSCMFAYQAFNHEDDLELAIDMRLLQDAELKTRYIAAFYWSMMTMTTVGYGDITLRTNLGRIFALAAMAVGAGVFAYGITNVVSLFQQLYEEETQYRREMDQVNSFMQSRELPPVLRDKVRANTFHWRQDPRGDDKERDLALVERLARPIRAKVADLFCERMLPEKMGFLVGCGPEFVHELYLHMRVQCYLPGEDIIRQGDYGSEMYFLFAGHAQVLLGCVKVATFGPNSCFGEFSIANPRKPRLATIQALEFCETHCVDREQILRLLVRHPSTLRSVRQLATLRSRKALALLYESGGKSRTLLQGLAMLWRAEGVQGVLPAGVRAESLPLLQEFVPSYSDAANVRRTSTIGTVSSALGAIQHHTPSPRVQQLQQFNANTRGNPHPVASALAATLSQNPTLAASGNPKSSERRSTLTVATLGRVPSALPPMSPSARRGEPRAHMASDDHPTVSSESDEAEMHSIRVEARPKTRITGRRTSIDDGKVGVSSISSSGGKDSVGASTATLLDERLTLLLTEVRAVAKRQSMLEDQLGQVLSCLASRQEVSGGESVSDADTSRQDEIDRFDEQHWLDQNVPPITRQRSQYFRLDQT